MPSAEEELIPWGGSAELDCCHAISKSVDRREAIRLDARLRSAPAISRWGSRAERNTENCMQACSAARDLLVPQLEHIVRYHLKQADVQNFSSDQNEIENEHGLNALIEKNTVNAIIGIDMSFEIVAFICKPLGLNLGNELAHSLISENQARSL